MSAVTAEPLRTRRGEPFTPADLDAMPDDGRRYEVIDGSLVVTPAPNPAHQRVVTRLAVLLSDAVPEGVEVLVAPLDVDLGVDTRVQPDVLVAHLPALTERGLAGPPLLAVEVLSPSTRRIDLTLKRSRYEEAGTPAYWVVDPVARRLVAWELRDGAYVQVADVSGDEAFAATVPFPVTVTPAALTGA